MSVSVSDLQARIAEVSADIEHQKAALKTLELSKLALQGQLNSLRDPVARLPLEISSDIFIRCLPAQPRPGAHHDAPMLFLNICSAWTAIAISTPVLWATISITGPDAEWLSEVLKCWLPRARTLPLAMSFRGAFVEDIASVIRPYSERLQNLELYPEDYRCLNLSRRIGPLPSLEALKICGFLGPYGMTISDVIAVLRVAPNLVDCTLQEIVLTTSEHTPKELVLPSLRYLRFSPEDDTDNSSPGPDHILISLTLPALKTLYIPMCSLSLSTFASFLQRSSPPLQKLFVGGQQRGEELDFMGLDQCLRLIPSLVALELRTPDPGFYDPFFATLAESSSSFLPALRTLEIYDNRSHLSNADYMALVRALFARRTQLVRFHLCSISRQAVLPGPDILAALQELRDAGMSIDIESNGSTV